MHPPEQGIGRAIVSLLLQSPPTPPLTVYICARDPTRGKSTLDAVLAAQTEPAHAVRLGKLDVLDQASVDAFADVIAREHGKVRSRLASPKSARPSTSR